MRFGVDGLLLVGLLASLGGAAAFLVTRSRIASRRRVEATARDHSRLSAEIAALKDERCRIDGLLEGMEEGIIVLSEQMVPVLVNRSARRLLRLEGASLPPAVPSDEIVSIARRAMVDRKPIDEVIDVWPTRTNVRVGAIPLDDDGGVAIVLTDVTQELRTLRIRRQLVANASHELKSPVASLQALAEAIRDAVHDDAEAAVHFSDRLVAESERLGRLISDLLDLSRLEDPAYVSRRRTDLSAVASGQFGEVRANAEARNIEVSARIASGVWVEGDDQQLGLMIRNLLDNAVRYTPAGGKVTIEVWLEGDSAVLEVSDTGIGIPLKAQARVFERFYRVDEGRARDQGGTGLGLSIVKHVVELHGGHVALESELGEGTTVTVRLPAGVVRQPIVHPAAS